jgi:uncharacterized surface protein with fasciclin (FAS1) repeats
MVFRAGALVNVVAMMTLLIATSAAFQQRPALGSRSLTFLRSSDGYAIGRSEVENFLEENYSTFYNLLLARNEEVIKKLRENEDTGFTVFAPNEGVFTALGEKRKNQLMDERNLESAEKMGAYHVIGDETVSKNTLLDENVGGVLTIGGEVRVGPSQSGGFFGIGAKDDGGVVVGTNGHAIQSFNIGPGVVHEVDALVSPEILWRYCDQLRIPGA